MSAFQGAIIAAGRGERLRASGGATLPKPLVELGGAPMLVRQTRAMLAAGAAEVLAVINHETAALAAKIELPDQLKIIVRDTESSMESLFTLGEALSPGHFLLATVDAVLPPAEFVRFAREARDATAADDCDGALAVVKWRGDHKPLFTRVSPSGLIEELSERPAPIVTAGIYWLPTTIFALVEKARAQRLAAMRAFLAMLLANRFRLRAIEVSGAIDIDEAADLEAARRQVENRR
ncbi:MAG TPA: NDP-sugar synthase [Candidatus Binataceae bacterium]|nr:NDP-sugar synthase [Candidatus Binataceae bacterium]